MFKEGGFDMSSSEQNLPRNRFKKNPVLFKHEVGKVKSSAYNLPNSQFTYGKSPKPDKEGASAVVMRWDFPKPSQQPVPNRDFTKLNKMALKEKVVKSKSISLYRKEHDARVPVKQGKKGFELEIPQESFRYGSSNKPSTPINNVICNSYGNYSENFMLQSYEHKKLLKAQNKEYQKNRFINQSYDTKVKAAGSYVHPDRSNEEKLKLIEQFKLGKYQVVNGKVNKLWQNRQKLPPLQQQQDVIQQQQQQGAVEQNNQLQKRGSYSCHQSAASQAQQQQNQGYLQN